VPYPGVAFFRAAAGRLLSGLVGWRVGRRAEREETVTV